MGSYLVIPYRKFSVAGVSGKLGRAMAFLFQRLVASGARAPHGARHVRSRLPFRFPIFGGTDPGGLVRELREENVALPVPLRPLKPVERRTEVSLAVPRNDNLVRGIAIRDGLALKRNIQTFCLRFIVRPNIVMTSQTSIKTSYGKTENRFQETTPR